MECCLICSIYLLFLMCSDFRCYFEGFLLQSRGSVMFRVQKHNLSLWFLYLIIAPRLWFKYLFLPVVPGQSDLDSYFVGYAEVTSDPIRFMSNHEPSVVKLPLVLWPIYELSCSHQKRTSMVLMCIFYQWFYQVCVIYISWYMPILFLSLSTQLLSILCVICSMLFEVILIFFMQLETDFCLSSIERAMMLVSFRSFCFMSNWCWYPLYSRHPKCFLWVLVIYVLCLLNLWQPCPIYYVNSSWSLDIVSWRWVFSLC